MQSVILAAPLLLALVATAAEPSPSPRQLFEAGVKHLNAGSLPDAEQAFVEVVRQQPRNVGALGNLGVVYTRQQRWADAVEVYRRALALTPDNPDLYRNLGIAYVRQEDYASARPSLERALELRPRHPQVLELLAQCYLFAGDPRRAISMLESLGSAEPGSLYLLSTALLRVGEGAKARSTLEKLFASIPPAQANLLAGKAYYESALFNEALDCFLKAREAEPTRPDIALELGKTYISLRRTDDGRKALGEVLRAKPNDAEALYFLGALLTQADTAEDVTKGVSLLESSQKLRPGFWGSYYYLGKVHAESDPAAAIPLLERAAKLNPDERAVFYLLSRVYRRANKPDQARAAAARFAEIEKAQTSKLGGMK